MVLTLGVLLRGFFITSELRHGADPRNLFGISRKATGPAFSGTCCLAFVLHASTYSGLRTVTGTEKIIKKKY
jgi:hypothetical protein